MYKEYILCCLHFRHLLLTWSIISIFAISALSSAIAQLSTVQEKLEEVHYEQATADFYYLSELIKDYIGLVGAVKDVFAVSLTHLLIEKGIFDRESL